MQTLAQVKTQAISVLQSTTANSQLSSVIDNSLSLSLIELTRQHDFACCSKLVPVTMSPGVCYDRKGGFVFLAKATLHVEAGLQEITISFSPDIARSLAQHSGRFTVPDQQWDHNEHFIAVYNQSTDVIPSGTDADFILTLNEAQHNIDFSGIGSFSFDIVVKIAWTGLIFKKLRYVFDHSMNPVELVTFANLHGYRTEAAKLSLRRDERMKVVSLNSEQFVSELPLEGFLYGTVEVPTWETPEGALILKASIDFVYWNAVTHGNYLVGVFLPRQEGALDPPEAIKEKTLQGIIVDDSYLERQSFSMHGVM